jgi:peptidoglycan/LPS O-acetylase OafA/YrhL
MEGGIVAAVEKRVGGIDVLRGLCIVAVILNHVNLRIRLNQSSFGKWIGVDAINALVWNGHEGVRIFFVISGFLITTWTLRRWGELRRIEVRQFYAMRFARIVPCLVGLLALLAILDRAGVPRFTINTEHTTLARALFAALTFHINWLEAKTGYLPAAWDILWSLSVEEVFYLFFPVLCAWLKKPALLVAVFSAFVVAGPCCADAHERALGGLRLQLLHGRDCDRVPRGARLRAGQVRAQDDRCVLLGRGFSYGADDSRSGRWLGDAAAACGTGRDRFGTGRRAAADCDAAAI